MNGIDVVLGISIIALLWYVFKYLSDYKKDTLPPKPSEPVSGREPRSHVRVLHGIKDVQAASEAAYEQYVGQPEARRQSAQEMHRKWWPQAFDDE